MFPEGRYISYERIDDPNHTKYSQWSSGSSTAWVDVLVRILPTRLKVCANPNCHWVFIDQSHNLSRCWCRQWACGNLMKVRQFRARAPRDGHSHAALSEADAQ